jgi:hypothetical protein
MATKTVSKSKVTTIVVDAELNIAKETKNTFRFDADPAETVPPAISSIYIAKRAFGKGAVPRRVKKITVEWE